MEVTLIQRAKNLKNYYYKMLGYPGIYNAEELINNFCNNRTFWFGKYKGDTVASIIICDYQYVKWCLENLLWFSLTEEEQALFNVFGEGYVIHEDKMIIYCSGALIEPFDNVDNDVDYCLLEYEKIS